MGEKFKVMFAFRGKKDNNIELIKFCETLEDVCIKTIEGGVMTKDLALCIHGKDLNESHYVNTQEFLDALDTNLQERMN